jgi:hypothetical protein
MTSIKIEGDYSYRSEQYDDKACTYTMQDGASKNVF